MATEEGKARMVKLGPSPKAEKGHGDNLDRSVDLLDSDPCNRPLPMSLPRPRRRLRLRFSRQHERWLRRVHQENNAVAFPECPSADDLILSTVAGADIRNPFPEAAVDPEEPAFQALPLTFLLSARSSLVVADPFTTQAETSTLPSCATTSARAIVRFNGKDDDAAAAAAAAATQLRPVAGVTAAMVERGERDFGYVVEDCGSTTTSLFHLDGATPTSPGGSSRQFSSLAPSTWMPNQRPSSSQSHLLGLNDGRLVPQEASRISSESAMTILQAGCEQHQHEAPEPEVFDVAATMTRQEFEALPPAIRRKVRLPFTYSRADFV